MKTFWLFLCVLMVCGISFAAWSAMSASRARAAALQAATVAALEADRARAAAAEAAAKAAAGSARVAPPSITPPAAVPTAETKIADAATPAPAEAPKATPAPETAPVASAEAPDAAPATTDTAKSGGTVGATDGKFDIVPSKMVPQEDGTVLVDDTFTIKGDGSPEKPFEIPWELLIAAEKSYNPSEKLTKIPQAIAMLDGKRVRITGYVAFPLYVQEPRELLSMLNQWDGCCIGVPPTPYDAIEVTLKAVVPEDDRLATFGVVEGRFGVKPYVVGDWLVGLYVMDEGSLTAKQFNGAGT